MSLYLRGAQEPVAFSGFASKRDAEILIKAWNKKDSRWEVIGQTRSDEKPTLRAGQWIGSPDLYHWKTEVALYDSNRPSLFCFWNDTCFDPWYEGVHDIKIRVVESGGIGNLVTFDEGGIQCALANLDKDKNFYEAAYACKSKQAPHMTLEMMLVFLRPIEPPRCKDEKAKALT